MGLHKRPKSQLMVALALMWEFLLWIAEPEVVSSGSVPSLGA